MRMQVERGTGGWSYLLIVLLGYCESWSLEEEVGEERRICLMKHYTGRMTFRLCVHLFFCIRASSYP